eukprot:TRINITY_DN10363_c0_g1_i1.p1 TRINITY_DN10363_c0_g1~~TRINITY_DN10363_c0_g1_i1.p1  ORF type:complete len:294 (+),score=35.87 TRINITY_DN10363_c0_g1_i1:56-883(+)
MQSCRTGIKFQQFSSTQLVPTTPGNDPFESYNPFEHIWYSERALDARSNSRAFNAAKAQARAARLRHAVTLHDLVLNWPGVEQPEDVANNEGALEGHPAHPLAQMSSFGRTTKVVRFSDDVHMAQFDFVRTKQCELCSTHELFLNAFVSQVESAKSSSHALNQSKALGRGFRQRTEVEVQQEEDERSNRSVNVMLDLEEQEDPWVVMDATGEDDHDTSRGSGSSPDEGKTQQKRTKKCFWILDSRHMPGEGRKSCEDKRWQDHVRYCTAIVYAPP